MALTRQLLASGRKQIIQRRPPQLNESLSRPPACSVESSVNTSHSMCSCADLPPVYADTPSVDQVIMNLALNSRDAMADGGKLTLSSVAVEIDEAYSALCRCPARPFRLPSGQR